MADKNKKKAPAKKSNNKGATNKSATNKKNKKEPPKVPLWD